MTTLNLRVRHACAGNVHTTPLTLNAVRLGSGLIRLEGWRCDGQWIELVGVQWCGATGCDCYLIDDWPEHGGDKCPHGTLQHTGGPLTLTELQAAAREGLTVGEVITPISFPDNCPTCGQGEGHCRCQPDLFGGAL